MIERARTFADAVDRELVKPDHGAARGEVHVERGLAARGGGAVRDAGRGHERGPVHVVVHLVGVYALAVGRVELDDLRSYMRECQPYADGGGQKIEEKKRGRGGRGRGRTPPDFGILTTVMRSPYARCISTLSFSCPTTRMVFTAPCAASERGHVHV